MWKTFIDIESGIFAYSNGGVYCTVTWLHPGSDCFKSLFGNECLRECNKFETAV